MNMKFSLNFKLVYWFSCLSNITWRTTLEKWVLARSRPFCERTVRGRELLSIQNFLGMLLPSACFSQNHNPTSRFYARAQSIDPSQLRKTTVIFNSCHSEKKHSFLDLHGTALEHLPSFFQKPILWFSQCSLRNIFQGSILVLCKNANIWHMSRTT